MPSPALETSLQRSPFWILGASTRDNAHRIVELAEEKSLMLDPDLCQKARADLTSPRIRLSAEMSWLPGVSPKRAIQIASVLSQGKFDHDMVASLPHLAHANAVSAMLEILPVDISTAEIVDRIVELATLSEQIDSATVLREINEDRLIGRFAPVPDENAVEEELAAARRRYRNSIRDLLDRLPTGSLLNVMGDVVNRTTGGGQHHAPLVIEELVDSYKTDAQGFIEAETDNFEHLIRNIRARAASKAPELMPLIDTLDELLSNWNRVTGPIQMIEKTRGTDHHASTHIAQEIRSLGVDLFNEHGAVEASQKLTDLLRSSFSLLPMFSDRVSDDAVFLEEALKQRAQSEETRREWERDITFSAEIGLLSKRTIKISSSGIQWGNRVHPLETITRIRWGGTRHSVNGIPTGTTYEIMFGNESGEEYIRLRRRDTFTALIDKLWRAVGIQIAFQCIASIKGGEPLKFGDAMIRDDGVVLVRHSFLSTQPVNLDWSEVRVWSADGSFFMGAKNDHKVYVQLPYIKVSNVQVLENLIRLFFKSDKPRLSMLFD